MAYPNLPPNLQDMFYNLDDRIKKLETIGQGNTSIETVNLKTAFNGSQEIDLYSYLVWFYNIDATGNGTLDFRGNSTLTLDDMLNEKEAITCVVVIKNGTTPYYITGLTVDGSAFDTVVWAGGAPTSGNASSEDVYSFTITKLDNTPTWHCRAQVVSYA